MKSSTRFEFDIQCVFIKKLFTFPQSSVVWKNFLVFRAHFVCQRVLFNHFTAKNFPKRTKVRDGKYNQCEDGIKMVITRPIKSDSD